jgi:hypothetical protein
MLASNISFFEGSWNLPITNRQNRGRRNNAVPCNIFVDEQFHWIEVESPEAYADSFWITDHGNQPRCFHRLNQKIYASLICEIARIRNLWTAGDLSNLSHQACEDRFQQIDERAGQYFQDENLPALIRKHPKFPAPCIDWELVAM